MPRLQALWGSWNRSLVVRLTGLCLLLSLTGAGLVAGLVYFEASAVVQTLLFSQLDAAADMQHAALTRRVDELRRNLIFVASLPDVRTQAAVLLIDKAGQTSEAYRILSYDLAYWVTGVPDLQEVFVADADGAIAVSTDTSHEGASVAAQPFFAQGRFNTYLQTVYLAPKNGQPLMTLATPLYDQNKQPVGVLGVNVDVAHLAQMVGETTGLAAGGEIYLVDRSRRFVSAPGWAAVVPHPPAGAHSIGIDTALQGDAGQGFYLNYAGRPVVGVYRWLDDYQLALVAEESAPPALASAGRLALMVLGLGLAWAVVMSFMVYWVMRQVAEPVALLTETVNRVAAGDLALRAPVTAPDELGVLARAFNEMIVHLSGFIASLEGQLAATRLESGPPLAEARSALAVGEVDALAQEALQLLSELRQGLERRDGPALHLRARRLKAVSVQLQADRLAVLCQKLEDAAEAADWGEAAARLGEIEVEWERRRPCGGPPSDEIHL